MNEKMMKTLGIIAGGFVLLILIIFLLSRCGKASHSYEDLVKLMNKEAKSYYKSNKKELPAEDKDTVTLTLKKMISDGRIPELTKYFNDEEAKCDGYVTVTNNNGYYLYTPTLTCGNKFQTKLLKDQIIENSLVEKGVGLYQQNEEYIFKGEVLDNYVQVEDNLYRIIRINSDGTIKMISTTKTENCGWDDRYNGDIEYEAGINEYIYNDINSRIRDFLIKEYENEKIYTDEFKSYIVTQEMCIGKRGPEEAGNDGTYECSQTVKGETLGLISVNEYLQASLSPKCVYPADGDCNNFNWLSNINTWTITADSTTSYKVWRLINSLRRVGASGEAPSQPTVVISDKTQYLSGTGTEEDPYKLY